MSTGTTSEYAIKVANASYDWYNVHAIRARYAYMVSETSLLIISASIPLLILVVPERSTINAIASAIVVVLVGSRSIFHWQDNFLRFSRAREAVEVERRRYTVGREPYSDPSVRDAILVDRVSEIEQEELGSWLKVAAQTPSE